MDYSIPPSYIEATNREWLPFVAPYLTKSLLYSGSLVSIRWHDILTPHLWGHPALHFGIEVDHAHDVLKRFISILSLARIEVRRLTHTLYLCPIPNVFNDGPRHQWLRRLLEGLPNLQCLVVAGIHFFDHAALLALGNGVPIHTGLHLGRSTTFPLHLLIASQCINSTPHSLRIALERLPHLIFLDLSRTAAVRDDCVLATIGSLSKLQILKLRGVGLQDNDLRTLADSLNPREAGLPEGQHAYRLRSLDVRDNLLTDESVKIIIRRLIHHGPIASVDGQHHSLGIQEDHTFRSSLIAQRIKLLLRGPDLDKHFINNLSHANVDYGNIRHLDRMSITHLYIANNPVSARGLMSLAKNKNLHVMDIGALKHRTYQATHPLQFDRLSSLTYLRIDNPLVTAPARIPDQEIIRLTTQGSQLSDSNEFYDTSASKTVSPVHSNNATPFHEDLPPYEQPDPASSEAGPSRKPTTDHELRRNDSKLSDESSLPPYTEASNSVAQDTSLQRQYSRSSLVSATSLGLPINDSVQSQIQQIIRKRENLRYLSWLDQKAAFPGRTPNLQTLVLTSIPPFTRSAKLIQNIQDFITDCALEHHLATEQAHLELIPPRTRGISQSEAIQQRSQDLFPLHKIILELLPHRPEEQPEPTPIISPPTSPTSPTTNPRISKSKTWSSVNDQDVDTFWEAAKDDFSFFDEEQESPTLPPQNLALARTISSTSTGSKLAFQPLLDVVAEIAKWRAEKRKQREVVPDGIYVPGAWPGKVEIVRLDGKREMDEMYQYSKWFGMDRLGL